MKVLLLVLLIIAVFVNISLGQDADNLPEDRGSFKVLPNILITILILLKIPWIQRVVMKLQS